MKTKDPGLRVTNSTERAYLRVAAKILLETGNKPTFGQIADIAVKHGMYAINPANFVTAPKSQDDESRSGNFKTFSRELYRLITDTTARTIIKLERHVDYNVILEVAFLAGIDRAEAELMERFSCVAA